MFDPVARAEREHAANIAREGDFEAKIAALKNKLNGETDFDAIVAAEAEVATLEHKLTIAKGVSANSAKRLADAKEEAAKKAEAAQRTAIKKEAVRFEPLVHEIAAENVKQRARIAKLEEHRERAKAAGITDAETRVRRGPARTLPAITQTVTAWFGPDGTRYGSDMTHDNEGRSVKATDRVQREVVDTIREEMTLPGEMPERFADAIQLVDLQGRKL